MKNKNLTINIFMFFLLFLMLLTLEIDYLTYFFNTNYLLSFCLSLVFNTFVGCLLLKKIQIKNTFEKVDFIFFIILLGIFLITIVYPDRTFDTFNYHLYLQENPFGDKIGFDFFAGKNLNSFTYAFPDRLFYVFRYFLGYRLGVILNYLIIITLYYQVKDILKSLTTKTKELTIPVIATLVVTSISLIDIVDSYYVDLISLVLLLEIFRLILNEKLTDKNSTYMLGYLGLLFGLSFVCKISNLFTLIVFFIVYVLRNKNIVKYINIKNIIITLFMLITPFIIYVIYNCIETGNPVFPFYNTIFHSKYFGDWNWLDTRFGPQRLRQVPIYPLLMVLHPNMSCDISVVEPIWGYGYLIAIVYVLYYLYKKFVKKSEINKDKLLFFVITIILYLVWSKFQLGYTRYGFIVLISGSISTYVFLMDIVKSKKYVLLSILVLLLLYNFSYCSSNYMALKQDWIYNNYYNIQSNYKYNIKNIFAKGDENKIKFEDGSVWAIFYYNSGLAQMVNNDIPIINITSSADNDYTRQLLEEKLNKASHIYTLVDSLDLNNFISSINNYDFKIIDVKYALNSNVIGRRSSFVYVFEIEKSNNYNANNFDIFCGEKAIDVTNKNYFSTFIGISKDSNHMYTKKLPITIIGTKNNQEYIIDELDVDYKGTHLKLNYDVSDYEKIKIVSLTNGKTNKNNWFMTINEDIQ